MRATPKSSLPKSKWSFVPHPRYGDKPRYTGLDVSKRSEGVYMRCWTEPELEAWTTKHNYHWIDPEYIGSLIPGTAIVADQSRQHGSAMLNTHYYDIRRKCKECGRPFIFFAEEQRYWYEELQFPVQADCVRCHPCRLQQRTLQSTKTQYDELLEIDAPSVEQFLEITQARLDLIEAGIFHARQLDHVRSFLRKHPEHPQSAAIQERLSLALAPLINSASHSHAP